MLLLFLLVGAPRLTEILVPVLLFFVHSYYSGQTLIFVNYCPGKSLKTPLIFVDQKCAKSVQEYFCIQ